MKTFVQELKTRRVYRVAIAYAVVGSGVVQMAGTVLPMFHAPEWSQQVFVVLIAICFPMALMLAWSFDVKEGAIRRAARTRGTPVATNRARMFMLGLTGLLVAALALGGYWWWHPWSRVANQASPARLVSAKSIAVLPFENLSDEKQTTYFVDGVQDEILTRLSKIADLKVISRTSVLQYKTGTRNLRAIAEELGVANIVEGTIQRAGERVRISVQLIDARTDTHLWADHFDRTVADVFAIQTEVAERVAAQLQAKLSPHEKAALSQPPTRDLDAYELYLRARNLIDGTAFTVRSKDNLLTAASLLEQAVGRDAAFLAGYCELAHAHDLLYFLGIDHTATQIDAAEAALQHAQQLDPAAGETHLAWARHYYWTRGDYAQARRELELATAALPNEPAALLLAGFLDRRQGRWTESTTELEHALELDPKNTAILSQISFNYESLHRYSDKIRVLERILRIAPDDLITRVEKANVELQWHADPRPLEAAINAAVAAEPEIAGALADRWIDLALCKRDPQIARRALAAIPEDGLYSVGFHFPKAYCGAAVARALHHTQEATAGFAASRAAVEEMLKTQPDYAQGLSLLGVCDAGLGRKEAAIEEGKRAVELLPVSTDALTGPVLVENLALIYAWTGERDLACAQLTKLLGVPGDVSYGRLLLFPEWDDLRGYPCFEETVTRLRAR